MPKKASQKWNNLSSIFNSHVKGRAKKDATVADNVEILWPLVLKIITGSNRKKLNILDYGCGCGGFCKLIYLKGHKVTGVDVSDKMISTAINNSSKNIKYIVGGLSVLRQIKNKYDVITSLMVMQFIDDISIYASKISGLINRNGLFVVSVFNPCFVEKCVCSGLMFKSKKKLYINNVELDVFTRSENEYIKCFSEYGLEFLRSYYPKFSRSFVKKYKWPLSPEISEYMVLVFRKRG